MKKGLAILLLLLISCIIASCAYGNTNPPENEGYKIIYKSDNNVYYKSEVNGSIPSLPSNPAKSGYIFEGWYYDNGVWEKPFDINTLSTNNSEDITVYAKWNSTQDTLADSNGVKYALSSDGLYYIVTGYEAGTDSTLIIPMHYNNLPVKEIAAYAIKSESVTEIVIGESIVKIASAAFECPSLEKITIENAQAVIWDDCLFGSYNKLKHAKIAANALDALEEKDLTLSTLELTAGVTYYVDLKITDELIIGGEVKLAEGAFRGCAAKKLTLKEGIVSIPGKSFSEMDNLEEIVIPNSVKQIGYSAFAQCESLKSVTLGSAVETISSEAFYSCAIESIIIPSSVLKIEEKAFDNNSIGYVEIQDAAVNIGEYAFANNNLNHVKLGKCIVSISDNSFTNKSRAAATISKVDIGSIENWCSLKFDGKTLLYMAEELYVDGVLTTNLQIPSSVETVPAYAFYDAPITKLTVSDGTKRIENAAFAYCSQLTEVYVADTLEEISSSFSGCENIIKAKGPALIFKNMSEYSLEEAEITSGNIDEYTFDSRSSLRSIKLSDAVTEIAIRAFKNCENLEEIILGDGLKKIGQYAFENTAYYSDTENWSGTALYIGNYLIAESDYTAADTYSIREGTLCIADYVFGTNLYDEGFSVLELPSSLKYFGSCYFPSTMKSVNFNGTLDEFLKTEFESSPMSAADNLYIQGELISGEVTVGEGVTNIPAGTFKNSAVTSLKLPKSLTAIGYGTFTGTDISSVYFAGTLEDWCRIQRAADAVVGADLYIQGEKLIDLIVPESITYLNAFAGCSSIKSVTLHNNVTYVLLKECTNLEKITLGSAVKVLEEYAFWGCSSLEEIVFSDSLEKIGNGAFSGTALKSITLPDTVTEIGQYLFDNCSSLEYVNFGNGVSKLNTCFYGCDALKTVIIGNRVQSIPNKMFYELTSLESVRIGSSVSEIGEYAFYGCTALEAVEIGSSVSEIGKYAFCGCTSLVNFTIPANVTIIRACAFGNCGFTEIIIPDTVKTIEKSSFSSCKSAMRVIVGSGVEEIMEYAFQYCDNLFEVCNKSELQITIGSQAHGMVAYYAKAVITDEESSMFEERDGYLLYRSGSLVLLVRYNGSDTELTIPEDVTEIYKSVFKNNTSITKVVLPDTLTSIGDYVFDGCTSLKEVVLKGNSSITLGNAVFRDCEKLEAIDISRFREISFASFKNCRSITVAHINCDSIGDEAFYGCSSLSDIQFSSSVRAVRAKAFYSVSATRIVITSNIWYIGASAFSGINEIEFEQKSGWAYSDNGDSYVVYITADMLSDPRNAAILLNQTYWGAPWTRK